MGFKEKMKDTMFEKCFETMTKGGKQNMMGEMMDKCFGNMSPEEKKNMLAGCVGSPMMERMKNMMGKVTGNKLDGESKESGTTGFDPSEMFQKIMMSMGKSSELASYATPEVRALFEEWAEQIENEVLNCIKETNTTDPEKLAEHFKLSKDSINFFLTKLAQKDKIKLKADKV
jgi:hypothetical protein